MLKRAFISLSICVAAFCLLGNFSTVAQATACDQTKADLAMDEIKVSDLPAGTTFWGYYKCNSCGMEASAKPSNHVKGSVQCEHCGTPHSTERYYMTPKGHKGVKKKDVADKKTEREAKSGLKWTCPYCGNSNFKTAKSCGGCGSAHTEGRAYNPNKIPVKSFVAKQIEAHPQLKGKTKYVMWSAAAVVAVAGLVGAYYGFSTYEVIGEVAGGDFKHTIIVERFSKTGASDWESNVRESQPVMPVDGRGERAGAFDVHNRRLEIHHHERVQVGTRVERQPRSVAYTDYETVTVDNGNGSFSRESRPVTRYRTEYENVTVPVYENQPVRRYKVDYYTYHWLEALRRHTSGSLPLPEGEALPWPNVSPGELDRLRRQSEYKVRLTYKDGRTEKTYELEPGTESEFLNWKKGDKYMLVKNNFGMVIKVTPLNNS